MIDFIKELSAAVFVGILGPPLIAILLSLSKKAREYLKLSWVVSLLVSISAATLAGAVVAHYNSSSLDTLLVYAKVEPAVGNQSGSGDPQPQTKCPDGYYVTAINWWGANPSTKFCVGCLSGIQVVCRKLNIPK
jgi:hypothetical protein